MAGVKIFGMITYMLNRDNNWNLWRCQHKGEIIQPCIFNYVPTQHHTLYTSALLFCFHNVLVIVTLITMMPGSYCSSSVDSYNNVSKMPALISPIAYLNKRNGFQKHSDYAF
uniref:Transmembrane protein n=1 Tax=Heterorhabditis bacteriophora TaxID=37862 RepID=A0A1I7XH20_HETBA